MRRTRLRIAAFASLLAVSPLHFEVSSSHIKDASLRIGAAPLHAQHALVLSGGGARGLAHAGAIEALEALGYGTSLVVGTSMGSIIGALYAAGYTAPQIHDIIADENWLERFAAEPIVAGRARVPRRPLLTFGISRGRFHEGLIPATGVNQQLVELLFDAGVRAGNDFDRLPRRYRAVAADLGTGREVVLGSGDLPKAVRASMAVPGAFAPVYLRGRLLVDGGIANNLPVSVADSLADMPVVAVDVLALDSVATERGALNLAVRAVRMLIRNAQPAGEPDVLITPRIPSTSSEARFPADARPLIEAGAAAVRAQAPVASSAPLPVRDAGDAPATLDTLIIEHPDAAMGVLLRRMLEPVLGTYDADAIIARVDALYGSALFQAVWPRVERLDDGRHALVVDVTPVAATSVALSAGWNLDTGGAVWTVLRQRLSVRTPWELRVHGAADELGQRAAADLSAFSSVTPGLVWNVGAFGDRDRLRTFAGDSISGHLRFRRAGVWFGMEMPAAPRDRVASLLWVAETLEPPLGRAGRMHGPSLRISRVPLADRAVGIEPVIEADLRTGGFRYSRLHVAAERRMPLGNAQLALLADVAHTTRSAPLDAQYAATADLAPWLEAGDRRGRSRATLGADVAWPTVLDGYIRLRTRAFAATSHIDELRLGDIDAGAELGGVWPTVIGPISAGVAWGSRGRVRVNAAVGLQR